MRIVVVGHPRSGTNSLVEVLQCQPGLTIANEPFNEQYASWDAGNVDYHARLVAGERFECLLDEVLSQHAGIKELSYQVPGDHLAPLVRRPDVRVVTIRRRNLLQTAVSQLIAEQTDLWKTWDADGPLEARYEGLHPLDLDVVRGRMAWTVAEVSRVERSVEDVDHLALVYEDLYLTDPAAHIQRVWDFLGLPAVDTPEVRHYLSPAVRQARPSTYGRLPNIAEIEAQLGDDATGHIDDGLLEWTR